ncbi:MULTISPECIES: hypothetical protein [Pseudomonas]|uniref:hypothetical protein n=1 Tax=Pseudomonas TaxID=286 RepID=UPI001E32EEAB|nr:MULTISPECIES: hypothetical protein [Pseudomonas]MCE1115653.1 hypothetical protein [Pseudomonas sp. NMI795_08]
MSRSRTANAWADGHSFIGQIYLRQGQRWSPIHLQATRHDLSFGVDVRSDTGWLQTGGNDPAEAFLFRFHSRGPERLHFTISLARDSARQLDVDSNGRLGLYPGTGTANYWKLQPLEWQQDRVRCLLRDHQGHQVKALPGNGDEVSGLTVEAGTPREYLIVRAH